MNLHADDVAITHLWTARVAAAITGTDPDEILAFAQHESNFISNNITIESHGESCGVMTPEILAKCTPAPLLDQYLAGATHLAGWYKAAHGDRRAALIGVAGGFALIATCNQGPVLNARGIDVCTFPNDIDRRIAAIRAMRSKIASS